MIPLVEPFEWETPQEVDIKTVFKTEAEISYDAETDMTTVHGDLAFHCLYVGLLEIYGKITIMRDLIFDYGLHVNSKGN